MVGGEAVIYYGYARLTGDIDLFYGNTEENVQRLFTVLSQFWDNDIPGGINTQVLKQKGMVFQFGVPPNRIDLLNSIDGVAFEPAWNKKVIETIILNLKKYQVVGHFQNSRHAEP